MNKNTIDIRKDYSKCIAEQDKASQKNSTAPAILIVDDEKLIRQSVLELLSIHDFDCIEAASGQQAFDMLAEKNIDIMLLDLV